MTKLVEHHIKYKEIHGHDETVWMTQSEHKKLHFRLRKEGKCNVPVDELRRISCAAKNRTNKQKEYAKNNQKYIDFSESFGKNTRLHEMIYYNIKTGVLSYNSRFRGTNLYNLPTINI